jgi:hypothetical protein
MATEHREVDPSKGLRCVANSSNNDFRFARPWLATCDAENTDSGAGVFTDAGSYCGRDGQIWTDWYEYGICRNWSQPGDSFKWHSEYGKIGHGKDTIHSANLYKSSQRIDQPGARIGFHIVEHNPQAGARGFEDLQDAQDSPRKTTRGPAQSRVLNKNEYAAPSWSTKLQVTKGVWPAV